MFLTKDELKLSLTELNMPFIEINICLWKQTVFVKSRPLFKENAKQFDRVASLESGFIPLNIPESLCVVYKMPWMVLITSFGYNYYSKTSLSRIPMARLPWMIQTHF